jgi:DNA modification methylase
MSYRQDPFIRDRIVGLRRVHASKLRANPSNWRTHPVAQRSALRAVLEEIGYADALIARQTPQGLELVDGHLRAETTPDQLVPVLVVDLTDDEARMVLATHDPLAAMAEVGHDALRDLVATLRTDDPAIRDLLDDLADSAEVPSPWSARRDTEPDLSGEPRTAPGDLWLLGTHRLLCGDSTKPRDVERLMNGELASLFHTDPPYLVSYTGADRPSKGKNWSAVYHEVDIDDAEGFFRSAFSAAERVLQPDAAWYCWHAHRRASLIERIWDELDVISHQQIVWIKPSILHGYSFYPWRHEPCVMGWKRGHKPRHDGDNASVSSVWELDWDGLSRPVGNEHPTQKPTELFAIPIRKHTRRRDLIYEPFAGSGAQLLAAEALGRRCYAIEIEPRFCDVAVGRWEAATGLVATRVGLEGRS